MKGSIINKTTVDHTPEVQDTVSLVPVCLCATPTSQHYLSIGMPRNATEQLEIGRSQRTVVHK